MNPTTAAVLATVIVVGGRWAEGKAIEVKQAVGLMIAVLLLAGVFNINPKLGRMLSLVMLVSACLARPTPADDAYIVGIVKKLGFAGGQSGNPDSGGGGGGGSGGGSGPMPRSGPSGQSGGHNAPNPIKGALGLANPLKSPLAQTFNPANNPFLAVGGWIKKKLFG